MADDAKFTAATVIPTMRYNDAAAAITWLCEAFGFEKHVVVPGEDGTIPDKDYEALLAAEAARRRLSRGSALPTDGTCEAVEYDAASRCIHEARGSLYLCPECGRLAWQKPGREDFVFYEQCSEA